MVYSHIKNIQAYLGYYFTSIQAYLGYYFFFTPDPIQGISSSRDGYYLAVHCLPLNITNRYFEGVSSSATMAGRILGGIKNFLLLKFDGL
jgi:hypothetical protein